MQGISSKLSGSEPTPAEIAAYCAEIRAQWSNRTFRLRAGLPPVGLTVQVNETSVSTPTRRRASTVEID
ncbi:MAG TPA: hypothetical protein VG125_21980 [Pirellulales bacterium]|jgi:hypothetical protein|nr:hypothetical protein [Pirellulales bacterium]